MRFFLLNLTILISVQLFAQSSWNSNSFKFSKSVATLENMTGATNVSFSGYTPYPVTSGLISIPGFQFKYGLSSYTQFAVSPFGFIKLGADINNNDPKADVNVIAALYNGTYWDAKYKIVGTAPARKLIIEWTGVMQPSGEPTKYQLWLSEKTGTIEFVYQSVRGYYNFVQVYDYEIFCKATILQQTAIAGLKIRPGNNAPLVDYSAIPKNFDSIYPNTRFIFQPDTVKPIVPGSLTFSNVQAGCLSGQFTDQSANESIFVMERSSDGINYQVVNRIFVTSPTTSGVQIFNQESLQPLTAYSYRVYASNGFLNSDTVTASTQTLPPLINGIKSIPGDYPTITALLQDARCKHLGPDLLIELNNNYVFAQETLPITFPKTLNNRFINSITIRPAANTEIQMVANNSGPLIFVDSVKKVFIDGSAGGVGNERGITLYQLNPYQSVFQYFNAADSGGVYNCNIRLKCPTNLSEGNAIVFRKWDYSFSKQGKSINNFTLANNSITVDSPSLSALVYLKADDSTDFRNIKIVGNEFSKFRKNAIYIENGAENLVIEGNKFFQPDTIKALSFLPYNSASCVKLINTENVEVRNNYFGGSSNVWESGMYIIDMPPGNNYHFIHYQSNRIGKYGKFIGNKFSNISLVSLSNLRLIDVNAFDSRIIIDSSIVGSSNNIHSILHKDYFALFFIWSKTIRFTNNYLNGIHGQYPSGTMISANTFLSTWGDTTIISDNIIGGTSNPNANTGNGEIMAFTISNSDKNLIIKRNIISGMFSKKGKTVGIGSMSAVTNILTQNQIDSNYIHHLNSGRMSVGIQVRFNSLTTNNISNNNIFALQSTGQHNGNYGPEGTIYGIMADQYNSYNSLPQPGQLNISSNKIHSFEPRRELPNSTFELTGISASSERLSIYNNDIRLGINSIGNEIDTIKSTVNGIIVSYESKQAFIENNSVFIGGRGYAGTGIGVSGANQSPQQEHLFILNNIIQVDRKPSFSMPVHKHFINVGLYISKNAKNVWHSNSMDNLQNILEEYKIACNCDSSSFVGNPNFINPNGDSVSFNLGVPTGSVADQSGTPPINSITTDINGLNRDAYSPVDIGSHATTPCPVSQLPNIVINQPTGDTVLLCPNNSVVISALINGGSFQEIKWQKNFTDIPGATGNLYSASSPGIYRLVGIMNCGVVASRLVVIIPSPDSAPPSVSITATSSNICSAGSITFYANPINTGSNPAFQWQVNGSNTGPNSPIFTTNLINNAQVNVLVIPTSACYPAPVTSNIINVSVTPSVTPNITIQGNTVVLPNQSTLISSTSINGGSSPGYLWQDSSSSSGWRDIAMANGPTLNYTPTISGAKIRCRLSSNAQCANPNIVFSAPLVFTINYPTSVDPVQENDNIKISPNPATDYLTIEGIDLLQQWETVVIYSVEGKEVLNRKIGLATKLELNIHSLVSGNYILLLNSKKGKSKQYKFVKL